MFKRVLSISFVISLLLPLGISAHAQSCTTAVCNAASANESDVLAALPSSNNTNSTVVVKIPSGTASWSSDLNYTIPSGITNLTIQGATTISWTGTPGTSSYAYTVNDQTKIGDSDPSNGSILLIKTGSSQSTHFTLSGITLEGGSGGTKYTGEVGIVGSSRNVRVTGMHVVATTYGQGEWFRFAGNVTGVADHNVADVAPGHLDNIFQAYNPADDTIGYGDGAWLNGPQFGTLLPLYIESNYFNNGTSNDCINGGRFVERYNSFVNVTIAIQTHGLKSTGGGARACIGYEAYHNYFIGPTGNSELWGAMGSKGGTALIWGNTMPEGYYRLWTGSTDRNGGDNANEINTPNGWGYCGAQTPVPSTGQANGVGSAWDGNYPSITQGYPCLDGIGRGQDTQALNGKFFPNRLNTVTNSVSWPHQYLIPIYMWNNTLNTGSSGNATYLQNGDPVAQDNRDFYYDAGSMNPDCPNAFNGTCGTGYGLLSHRPASCTAGPGGTYFTSPTGSYGVAYFATDANSGNGELYVCTSTNTWTPVYQPYTFPHPLVSGTSTSSSAPPAPTGLVSSVY
jgi:hypothetical protein